MKALNQRTLLLLFLAALVAYTFGLFMEIMNIDAAQYAQISREMLESNSFLVVRHHFAHYLDKPPLLFWLSAFSFKIFGISNFTYRLPSFLFSILAMVSTYKLAELFHGKKVALYAVIVLATCQAYFLFNHDVRTDTILAGSVVFSIWQLFVYVRTNKLLPFMLGFTGIACAMLSKGPIGVMVPVLALGMHFLLKKDWKNIFRWQWLAGIVWVLILLAPMMWGLYRQAFIFKDLVFDGDAWYQKNKFYGLKFFFWTQSFGRLTGENQWHNKHDPFFFVHSFLWSFMPWALVSLAGFGRMFKNLFSKTYHASAESEFFTFGGIILPFIAFSLSKYVLPHYIFVFYPLVAIVTAKTLDNAIQADTSKLFRSLFGMQVFAVCVIGIIGALLIAYVFPTTNPLIWTSYIIALAGTIYFLQRSNTSEVRLIVPSAFAIIMINIIMNSYFYPTLLNYQADLQAAKFGQAHHIPKEKIHTYGPDMCVLSFEFNSGNLNAELTDSQLEEYIKGKDNWLLTNSIGLEKVKALNGKPKSIVDIPNYPVTKLTGKFLNPKKRSKVVKTYYLLSF